MSVIPSFLAAALAALAVSAGAAQTQAVFSSPVASEAQFSVTRYSFTVSGPSDVVGGTSSRGGSWSRVQLLSNAAAPFTREDSNPDDGFSFTGLPAATYLLSFERTGGGYGGYYEVSAAGTAPSGSTRAIYVPKVEGPGAFMDTRQVFNLSGAGAVQGRTLSSGVSWSEVQLTSNAAAPLNRQDSNPDDGFSFQGLPAATYALNFRGSGDGGFGGFYTVAAAPVPEPASAALMLAGLLGLGGLARRRRPA